MILISKITKTVGQRLRNFRSQRQLSQEKLAELAGVHPTYIGQIERGEKNITIESLEKIATALQIPLCKVFEKLDSTSQEENYPLAAYELFAAQDSRDQKRLLHLLEEIIAYKND